jgi:hypothetical protein
MLQSPFFLQTNPNLSTLGRKPVNSCLFLSDTPYLPNKKAIKIAQKLPDNSANAGNCSGKRPDARILVFFDSDFDVRVFAFAAPETCQR